MEWRLLAFQNGASPDCIVVVVVLDAIFTHVSDHTQNSSHAAV